MSAVKASSRPDPARFLAHFQAVAAREGFRTHHLGAVGPDPLLAFTRRARGVRPRIYLSSGIHGDEPAGPDALLALLEGGAFHAQASWFLVPLLNPAGLRHARRENAAGLDLNRDYRDTQSAEVLAHRHWLALQPRFDIAFCLHEDWEAAGFYLYELNQTGREGAAGPLLRGGTQRLPIEPATTIDGRPVTEPGIIRPDLDPLLRDQWAEAIYLYRHHTALVYTLETPSAAPLEWRVEALVSSVRAALPEPRAAPDYSPAGS